MGKCRLSFFALLQNRFIEILCEKYFLNRMTFDAVISGSALQPHTAPAMMQSMIKDLNVRTMTDLLSAISVNLMTTAWKMEGGWKNWFYAICKGIVKVVGRVIISSSNVLQSNKKVFENELINYFQSQGYSSDQSAEMSQHIANEMTEGWPFSRLFVLLIRRVMIHFVWSNSFVIILEFRE